jgi:hypothetical protein
MFELPLLCYSIEAASYGHDEHPLTFGIELISLFVPSRTPDPVSGPLRFCALCRIMETWAIAATQMQPPPLPLPLRMTR